MNDQGPWIVLSRIRDAAESWKPSKGARDRIRVFQQRTQAEFYADQFAAYTGRPTAIVDIEDYALAIETRNADMPSTEDTDSTDSESGTSQADRGTDELEFNAFKAIVIGIMA